MQFQTDMLGVPVNRPTVLETTASGAAFLAGLGVGFWDSPEALRGVRRCDRMFQQAMVLHERDKLYATRTQAVAHVRAAGDKTSG